MVRSQVSASGKAWPETCSSGFYAQWHFEDLTEDRQLHAGVLASIWVIQAAHAQLGSDAGRAGMLPPVMASTGPLSSGNAGRAGSTGSSGGDSNTFLQRRSGGVANRDFYNGACRNATGTGSGGVGGMAFRASMTKGGDIANNVISRIATGGLRRTMGMSCPAIWRKTLMLLYGLYGSW